MRLHILVCLLLVVSGCATARRGVGVGLGAVGVTALIAAPQVLDCRGSPCNKDQAAIAGGLVAGGVILLATGVSLVAIKSSPPPEPPREPPEPKENEPREPYEVPP